MLTVRVVSPERTVFEGEARSVVAPAWDGEVGILPRHAPMISLLGAGKLSVDLPDGGSHEFWVAGGALKVDRDLVMILTEHTYDEAPDPDTRARLLEEVNAALSKSERPTGA